jgi:hypothetical protein
MGVKPLPIETLPREKSLELLAAARPEIVANGKDRDAADDICHLLGDLPLALTVAAAYLSKYQNDSIVEYLEALSSQPAIQDSSLEKEVSACFALSFNNSIQIIQPTLWPRSSSIWLHGLLQSPSTVNCWLRRRI